MFLPVSILSINEPIRGVMTVQQAVDKLNAGSSADLSVEKSIAKDLVFIEPHGASREVVIRSLARSLDASLVSKNSGREILRTKEDLANVEKKLFAERKSAIERKFAELRNLRAERLQVGLLEAVRAGLAARQEEEAAEAQGKVGATVLPPQADLLLPAQGLLQELMLRIGLEKIASVKPGTQVVLEDRPVAGARPLPDYQDLLPGYELAAKELSDFRVAEFPSFISRSNYEHNLDLLGHPYKTLSRLRLQIQCLSGSMACGLEVYDATGQMIDSSGWGVSFHTMQFLREALADPSRTPPRPVPVPKPTSEVLAFAADPHNLAWPDWFLRPEKVDPVKLVAEPVLELVADQSPEKCFLATVNEDLWSQITQSAKDQNLYLSVLENRLQASSIEVEEDKDSLVWSLADPEYSESKEANRNTLSRITADIKRAGYADLRKLSKLLHDPSPRPSHLSRLWEQHILASTKEWPDKGDFQYGSLELLGAINDEDWAALLSGSQKTAEQMGITNDLQLFFEDERLDLKGNGPVPEIYRHAEELFDQATMGQTIFSAKVSRRRMYHRIPAKGKELPIWGPPDGIMVFGGQGLDLNGQLSVKREQFEANIERAGKFQFGTTQTQDLTLTLPHGYFLTLKGPKDYVEPDADEPISYSQLPQDFRDRLWKESCDLNLANRDKIVIVSSDDTTPQGPPPAKP